MVRILSLVHPGIRRTRDQIVDHAAYWKTAADRALVGGAPVLVALGDSLAQGIGASSPQLGYVGLLAAKLADEHQAPVAILNLSRSGARIGDVLGDQLAALRASGVMPVAVVCTVGSNDLLRDARFGAARSRMTELIGSLPEGAVLATLPDAGSLLAKQLNRHLRKDAARHGRAVADLGALLTSWKGLGASDRFHPNDAGYQCWAQAFEPLIMRMIFFGDQRITTDDRWDQSLAPIVSVAPPIPRE